MNIEVILEHLQANMVAYGIIALCILPILYMARKYVVPFIFYTLEILVYMVVVHVSVYTITRVAAWFRDSSSFDNAFGRKSEQTNWSTPLLEFWQREAYEPSWVFWFEIVVSVLIVIAVFRYRPMKIHKGRDRRYSDTGKRIGSASKSMRGRMGGRGPARGGAPRR